MSAVLVPPAEIPGLAARVSPDMLAVLRRVSRDGFFTSGVDEHTSGILRQLNKLGLIDPRFGEELLDWPSVWIRNHNGSRVLVYLTGIRSGPYYEVSSSELADWIEQQGADHWWFVGGDPLLTGLRSFPCPAGALVEELRRLNRALLVQARKDDVGAHGQVVGKEKLDEVAGRFGDSAHPIWAGATSPQFGDRILSLCWKGSIHEWRLREDSEAARQLNPYIAGSVKGEQP